MRKTIFALILCILLLCLLAGCGHSAGDAASKVGKDVSSAISRVESGMNSSRTESSRYSAGSHTSSSSGFGDVDSGRDGYLGDEPGVSSTPHAGGSSGSGTASGNSSDPS